jgi:hypothetical protein
MPLRSRRTRPAKLVDPARITGNKPDGYTLDDLDFMAETLQGWASREPITFAP